VVPLVVQRSLCTSRLPVRLPVRKPVSAVKASHAIQCAPSPSRPDRPECPRASSLLASQPTLLSPFVPPHELALSLAQRHHLNPTVRHDQEHDQSGLKKCTIPSEDRAARPLSPPSPPLRILPAPARRRTTPPLALTARPNRACHNAIDYGMGLRRLEGPPRSSGSWLRRLCYRGSSDSLSTPRPRQLPCSLAINTLQSLCHYMSCCARADDSMR
jgi:hypothetical protein